MTPIEQLLEKIKIPPMATVAQRFPAATVPNHLALLRQELETQAKKTITPGMKVAVTAGSRGIFDIANITRTVVDFLKEKGAAPFVVSAMGSHGGANAQGQLDVLAGIGITPESMGVPIVAGVESRLLATLDGDVPVWFDEPALQADAVVAINRIKPHTGFRGKYESGLAKMLAVGLGNAKGADYIHSRGEGEISGRIETIARAVLERVNVAFGVAILENSEDKIGELHVIPGRDIMEREAELLPKARKMLPEIHFKNLDLLIVDRMGKDISGGGMDPNVIGGFTAPGVETTPRPQLIVVLDLTEATHGAVFGLGDGDVTTRRLFEKIDFATTYPNCLVTCTPRLVKIPMVMENQELAIKAGLKMLLSVDRERLRVVRIPDTLHIDTIQVSEALLPEAEAHPGVTVLEGPSALPFDSRGNLF